MNVGNCDHFSLNTVWVWRDASGCIVLPPSEFPEMAALGIFRMIVASVCCVSSRILNALENPPYLCFVIKLCFNLFHLSPQNAKLRFSMFCIGKRNAIWPHAEGILIVGGLIVPRKSMATHFPSWIGLNLCIPAKNFAPLHLWNCRLKYKMKLQLQHLKHL